MLGSKLLHFDSLNSTNDYLINLCKNYRMTESVIVIADMQIKGRGRLNNKWYSKDGLFFSFLLKSDDFFDPFFINILTSLSLIKVLRKVNIQAMVKYPNDIIVSNKKIAGILIENIVFNHNNYLIVGVGLNVNNTTFPSHIEGAVSMNIIRDIEYDKIALLNNFVLEFSHLQSSTLKGKNHMIKKYLDVLYGYQKYVLCDYKGERMKVKVLSISNKGILTIQYDNAIIKTVSYMDIRFLLS
jgi:BirA family biotin operon repressor/biotin-[acetyl-CoA-carboxylase] ligase